MVQAVLLDLFMSEPDTSAAAAVLVQSTKYVVYVARTNQNSWPENSPSFRALVKCWLWLLCRTCILPSSRWAVAGCMHLKVAMADDVEGSQLISVQLQRCSMC